MNTDTLFIVDEYQDFNEAEEKLSQVLTRSARGLLIVGDDDQVLYDTLKSGKADAIVWNRFGRETTVAVAARWEMQHPEPPARRSRRRRGP